MEQKERPHDADCNLILCMARKISQLTYLATGVLAGEHCPVGLRHQLVDKRGIGVGG